MQKILVIFEREGGHKGRGAQGERGHSQVLVRINTYKVQRPVMSHILMMSQCSVLHIIHGDLTAWWYSGNTLNSHL